MYANCGDHDIAIGINEANVVRFSVDGVDLVPRWAGSDAGGIATHRERAHNLERPRVNHANRVALAVGDVDEFAADVATATVAAGEEQQRKAEEHDSRE